MALEMNRISLLSLSLNRFHQKKLDGRLSRSILLYALSELRGAFAVQFQLTVGQMNARIQTLIRVPVCKSLIYTIVPIASRMIFSLEGQ